MQPLWIVVLQHFLARTSCTEDGVTLLYGHEFPDAEERLSQQHVYVLLYAYFFRHWDLVDSLYILSLVEPTATKRWVLCFRRDRTKQGLHTSTDGEVANAAACKAVIHGFKSHSVLQMTC